MKKLLFPLLFFVVLQNCTHQSNDQRNSKELQYQVGSIKFSDEIPFKVTEVLCQADSNKIIVKVEIRNLINTPYTVSIFDWELETAEGTRSPVINTFNPTLKIATDKTSKLDLVFDPTNSLKLFRQSGFKGYSLQSYKLTYKGKSTIDLHASDSDYALYKKDKKEPEVFLLSVNDHFKNDELSYVQANLGLDKNGVEIHEQEILVNGLNIVLSAYTYNETLFVKWKLVNHSLFPVGINPAAMTVQFDNKTLVSIAKHETNETTIARSQRGYIEERYPIGKSTNDQFLLNVTFIFFMAQKPVPVFYCESISMKRTQLIH